MNKSQLRSGEIVMKMPHPDRPFYEQFEMHLNGIEAFHKKEADEEWEQTMLSFSKLFERN